MKKDVKTSQLRSRIILKPGESVVVRCRDNHIGLGRRRVIVLHPGDRVIVRCRKFVKHNNNNHNNNNNGRIM